MQTSRLHVPPVAGPGYETLRKTLRANTHVRPLTGTTAATPPLRRSLNGTTSSASIKTHRHSMCSARGGAAEVVYRARPFVRGSKKIIKKKAEKTSTAVAFNIVALHCLAALSRVRLYACVYAVLGKRRSIRERSFTTTTTCVRVCGCVYVCASERNVK